MPNDGWIIYSGNCTSPRIATLAANANLDNNTPRHKTYNFPALFFLICQYLI